MYLLQFQYYCVKQKETTLHITVIPCYHSCCSVAKFMLFTVKNQHMIQGKRGTIALGRMFYMAGSSVVTFCC
jgi:hypothetical protein